MEERRRTKAERQARRGIVASAQAALMSDAALAARAAGTLASVTSASLVVGLVLAFLAGDGRAGLVIWGAIGTAALLGPTLSALIIAARRDARDVGRYRMRAFTALGIVGLGTIAGVVLFSPLPPLVAGGLGILTAAAAVAIGIWSLLFVERAVLRAARARRRDWYAQLRASRLTRRMIGYPAYRQLRRDGVLPVKSTVYPNRTYLVPMRTTPSGARILVLEQDRPIGGLCLRPREPLPDPEEALTHILAIRTDERAWLNRANFFPQDRALTPQALGLAPGRPGNYDR
jgi:hypothetical protein